MKKLSELYNVDSDVLIKDIKINSKDVEEGDLFICTMGASADRHNFIDSAIENGAAAVVVSKDVGQKSVPIIKVEDTNKELPILCRKFYDEPQNKLKVIGVTGTDGKTSTATIIQTLIGNDKTGYIGTNGRSCSKFKRDTANSTPDADKLYGYFNEFVEAGCKYVAMEASSEAFYRGRMQGLSFDVSVITNITPEHLNIHKTIENYADCKCMLFDQTKEDGYSILNYDDKYFEYVKKHCKSKVLTYGMDKSCDLYIKDFKVYPDHTDITYVYKNKDYNITSPLLGDFNVYNLAAGMLASIALGYEIPDLAKNISKINVDGRLDMIDTKSNYYVMVDYAHTPNGISNLLKFVHTLDIKRSIVVTGVAGERDHEKRPVMGKTILDNATYAIFTSEDPRSEDPMDIANDLISEAKKTHDNYEIVLDRREAIKKAINMAEEKDIVLILGKGNETYQKLKDGTIYFNDVEEAKKAIEERNSK